MLTFRLLIIMHNIITILREAVQRRQALKLPAYERGWLAGIIDGDGSLSLKQFGKTFCVRVTVTNTNSMIIEHLLKVSNVGHVYKREAYDRNKAAYYWEIEHQHAKQILSQIVLKGKEAQRKLLLEAQDLIEQQTAGYQPYLKRLEAIRKKVQELNR